MSSSCSRFRTTGTPWDGRRPVESAPAPARTSHVPLGHAGLLGRRVPTDPERSAGARRLAERYLAERPSAAQPASGRWVGNQNGRWGSCTPADRTIRISDRIMDMPDWVVDYVLLHELVHLVVPSHSTKFWALVGRYPRSERARGYLEGVSAAGGQAFHED